MGSPGEILHINDLNYTRGRMGDGAYVITEDLAKLIIYIF